MRGKPSSRSAATSSSIHCFSKSGTSGMRPVHHVERSFGEWVSGFGFRVPASCGAESTDTTVTNCEADAQLRSLSARSTEPLADAVRITRVLGVRGHELDPPRIGDAVAQPLEMRGSIRPGSISERVQHLWCICVGGDSGMGGVRKSSGPNGTGSKAGLAEGPDEVSAWPADRRRSRSMERTQFEGTFGVLTD